CNHTGVIKGWEYSTDLQNWTATNNTTSTQTFSNLNATTYYRVLIQSGVCSGMYSDTAVITVYQAVTTAAAGADRILCLQDTFKLNANKIGRASCRERV